MIACKSKIFDNQNYGASITEVLLAMAIVATATPFVYKQISNSNQTLRDIAFAKSIINSRDNVLNFIRINQDKWPESVQIKLDQEDMNSMMTNAVAGFIDKYPVTGTSVTDVYLAFDIADTELQAKKIAKHIGSDAAVVTEDGIAYGNTWAVVAPEFMPGNVIYRITRNISSDDTSKYLHRATSGEDDFNVMLRDLNMSKHNIHDIATLVSQSEKIKNANTTFVNSDHISAKNVYFSGGANISGQEVSFGNLRVSGDTYGFRNIYADTFNASGFTTNGTIIADKVNVQKSINIGNNMVLKSDSSRTISAFTSISASNVLTPFISSEEIIFHDNFGLTISGELLMSTSTPFRIGNWNFPSTKPPYFTKFDLQRGTKPNMPSSNEFDAVTKSGWQDIGK